MRNVSVFAIIYLIELLEQNVAYSDVLAVNRYWVDAHLVACSANDPFTDQFGRIPRRDGHNQITGLELGEALCQALVSDYVPGHVECWKHGWAKALC